MIELTEQQAEALSKPDGVLPRVLNPQTNEMFVLLSVDEYERLKSSKYDDSSWTREELTALAWERMHREPENEWPEYNDAPEHQ
jgi:uncharacterized Zn finger protein